MVEGSKLTLVPTVEAGLMVNSLLRPPPPRAHPLSKSRPAVPSEGLGGRLPSKAGPWEQIGGPGNGSQVNISLASL